MKRKIIILTNCFIFLFCIAGFIKIEPKIHYRIAQIKDSVKRYLEYQKMHKPIIDLTVMPNLTDEADAWYTQYHVIAHGGGGIDGRTYTNSLEAWDYSYSKGTRVIDADMIFTSDKKLVLCHSWNDNLEQTSQPMSESKILMDRNGHVQYKLSQDLKADYATFMSRKIFNIYHPMSFESVIKFMTLHPDVYVSVDMKADNMIKDYDIIEGYKYIVKKAKRANADSILNRIIVNIYDYKMYDKILNIYPFKNIIARQHAVYPNNYTELAAFCIKKNIHIVNVSSCYADDEGIQILRKKGIRVIVAIADYISDMQHYRKKGFTGCVSSFLYEDIYPLTQPQ